MLDILKRIGGNLADLLMGAQTPEQAQVPFWKNPAFWKRVGPVLAVGLAGAAAAYGLPVSSDALIAVGSAILRALGVPL